jgi:nucleoside diphosphate kinase
LVLAIEVLAENCINKIKDFVAGIRNQFGSDVVRSAIYGSESAAAAAKELEIFFSSKSPLQAPAYFSNCSCLVIKPHLITENYVGQVFDAILASGFEVSAA